MKADNNWIDGLIPNSANWEFIPNVIEFKSTFTKSSKVIETTGHKWSASFNFINLDQRKFSKLRAMEAMSEAGTKSFAVPMFGYEYLGESKAKKISVLGTGTSGLSVATIGWEPNKTVLEPGDMIGLNGELKTVIKSVASNSSGNATIEFYPPIRQPLPPGEDFTYNPPLVTLRRIIQGSFVNEIIPGGVKTGALTAIAIGLEEVIY